jgi:hypothetical protein
MLMVSINDTAAFEGPLYVKNAHPMFVGAGSPYLDSANVERSVGLNLNYSSIYINRSSDDWSYMIDLEALITELRIKELVYDNLQFSVSIPYIYYYDGALDEYLADFHDTFNFADYGRSERPHNDFLFEVRKNDDLLIEGENGRYALGDILIEGKEILYNKGVLVSLKGFFDIPTGDANNGYGNGSMDWGFSLLADKRIGRGVMLYGNLGIAFADTYEANEDINLNDYYFGGAGFEWMYSRTTSVLAQLFVSSSPYDSGIREIDGTGTILSLGSKHLVSKKVVLEWSFSEDLNTTGAPDFMFTFGGTYKY